MKILVISDTHAKDKYLNELRLVTNEIFSYDADILVHLGDLFDNARPTPETLDFVTHFIKRCSNKYKKIFILQGNDSHEYYNQYSVIKYLNKLSNNIKICSGKEILNVDNKKICFGHYMLHESRLEYGSGKEGIKDLKRYDYTLLGHQHNPEELKKNSIYHLGSAIFVHFNEVIDNYKRIALIDNGELKFKKLQTPYPMIDVTDIKKLDKLNKNTKVRLVLSNFNEFQKVINDINKYENKFVEFKLKLNFDIQKIETSNKKIKKPKDNLNIIDYINKIKNKNIKEILATEFKKEL